MLFRSDKTAGQAVAVGFMVVVRQVITHFGGEFGEHAGIDGVATILSAKDSRLPIKNGFRRDFVPRSRPAEKLPQKSGQNVRKLSHQLFHKTSIA